MSNKQIFLARFGKVHGPLTEHELTALHESGRIQEYTWLWDSRANQWKPIDPPPPPLAVNLDSAHARRPGEATPSFGLPNGLLAIAHDTRSVVSGAIERVTETGCELVCGVSSGLSSSGRVFLNLLDPKSGKAVNVAGKLFDSAHTPRGWVYKIRWDQRPALT